MKIVSYLVSLLAAVATYLLFSVYLSVSAGLDSILPLISFYSSILVFGFFSCFHFFQPKIGAVLLTIALLIMFFSWPALLFIEHFTREYKPSLIESLLPFALVAITVALVRLSYSKHKKVTRWLAYSLAIPPALLATYVGVYFTVRYFDLVPF
ncbi:hypothetical protein I0P70_08455 [Pontibacter sp. FD36]|uniref:hypothetical protein n=1 Tax=Pontibacter sp. FD36 TaxID=2789860 RepID=UPI0018AB9A6F|nr:hypothetical protein [Pontibacter sp. FD36]MBF8963273.1 hypothetical protein [Pontibacter sp. FD36]